MAKRVRKATVGREYCVACGCCVKVCPKSAVHIVKGIFAEVDFEKCIGCGKCARECPASVIAISEVPL
ncbi:MAG: 4Fe-4S binding protein [Clostridiales bacterium]|nr:4Fe-4S binding protein [Clostridiales bacterium]